MKKSMKKRTVVHLAAVVCACALAASAISTLPAAASTGSTMKGSGLPFSEEMAELGDLIFDDQNLSIGRNQACNSCHGEEWGFTGPHSEINALNVVYEGSIPNRFGNRKPPSSAYSTLSPVLHLSPKGGGQFVGGNFFDGRATGEKLGNAAADQAQGPFLNPVEQGLRDSACVVYRVREAEYAHLYEKLWGNAIGQIQFPDNIDVLCQVEGPTLDIDPVDREKIEQEFNNIAIAIAVYEESHNLFSSKFDAMRKGLYKFTREEQRGFALFQGKGKCAQCHTSSGQRPAFTDHTYDNLGVPKNPQNPFYEMDTVFLHDGTPVNPLGEDWVDLGLGGFLENTQWATYAPGEQGKMRVPTLRNIDRRPNPDDIKAYTHNGYFKSLESVVHFYNTRDVKQRCEGLGIFNATEAVALENDCWPAPEVAENVNISELGNLGLTPDEEEAIVVFLKTLSDGYLSEPGGD
jgi:cytochrome c peroxidase